MAAEKRIVVIDGRARQAAVLISMLQAMVAERAADEPERPELAALSDGLSNPRSVDGKVSVTIDHHFAAEAAAVLAQIAWTWQLRAQVLIEPTTPEDGTDYTAIFLYPRFATRNYGTDITIQTVRAPDPVTAVALGRQQAAANARQSMGMDIPAHAFPFVTLLPGHLASVLDAPDLEGQPTPATPPAPGALPKGPRPG